MYVNLPDKLDEELSRARVVFPLYLSQVTDPLQPIPEVLEIAFRVVRIIIRHRLSFHLVTRSPEGIYRLIEEIPELPQYPYWFVAMTVEAPPEKQVVTSPGAPGIVDRLRALKWLNSLGVATVGRTDPTILGLLTRADLEWLIGELKDAGVSHIIASTGYFNRVSMVRLLSSIEGSRWAGRERAVARIYRFDRKDCFPGCRIFRASWHTRVGFHRWLRSKVEEKGLTYAVCQELPRRYDSPGIPTCEGVPKNFVHLRRGRGFEPIGCFGDCLRSCPNPATPPCGNPDLLTHYPYRLKDLGISRRVLTPGTGLLF